MLTFGDIVTCNGAEHPAERPATLLASAAEENGALKTLVSRQQVAIGRLEKDLAEMRHTAHQTVLDLNYVEQRLALAEGKLLDDAGVRADAAARCRRACCELINACRSVLNLEKWRHFRTTGQPAFPHAAAAVRWVLYDLPLTTGDVNVIGRQLLNAVGLAGWFAAIPEAARLLVEFAERDKLEHVLWARAEAAGTAREEAYSG